MEDNEPRDADEGDELEATIMQADHAFGAESVGTTVDEELAGESLDQRLAEERPDRPGTDATVSVVDEGELADEEKELVGDAVIERDEFASPRRRRCPFGTACRVPPTTTTLIRPTRTEEKPSSARDERVGAAPAGRTTRGRIERSGRVGCRDALDRAPGGHRDPPVDPARRVPDPRDAAGGTRPVPPESVPVRAALASVEMGRRAPEDGPSPGAGPGRRGALLLLRAAGRLGVPRLAGLRPDPVEPRVRGRARAGWRDVRRRRLRRGIVAVHARVRRRRHRMDASHRGHRGCHRPRAVRGGDRAISRSCTRPSTGERWACCCSTLGRGRRPRARSCSTGWASAGVASSLPELFAEWERWVADVLETHMSYPLLALFRSPHDDTSWVTSLGVGARRGDAHHHLGGRRARRAREAPVRDGGPCGRGPLLLLPAHGARGADPA